MGKIGKIPDYSVCTCEFGHSTSTVEWYKDGIPQRYCIGWLDKMTDEIFECCRKCEIWNGSDKVDEDLKKWREQKNGN